MEKYQLTQKQMLAALTVFSLITIGIVSTCGCVSSNNNTIYISGANALQPMMEIWAREYKTLHPEITIVVTGGGAGKGMTEALAGQVEIGMVSREIDQTEIAQGAFWISVAKDAVFATMNTNNPVKDSLFAHGISKAQLADIFTHTKDTRTYTTWGQLVNNSNITNKIIVYTRQDSCGAADQWAKFLGSKFKQDNLTNSADVAVIEDAPLRDAIVNDQYAIGYNNLNTIYNLETKEPYAGILPIPLDLNENGLIDANETFYQNSSTVINAINSGLYPSPPARNLHLVTKTNFTGITKDFIAWILTDGQQYVLSSGYVKLSDEIIQQQMSYLNSGLRPTIQE
ncbi:MAG: substrate-binding domain-containing protein [Candidatus Thermoplasmatota archaeon]|nr:substrate-binding domain-containing protein [Candidatus Thermoplasmatota archaeon]